MGSGICHLKGSCALKQYDQEEQPDLSLDRFAKMVSVLNTMFKHVRKCMWHQGALRCRSVIDSVIVSPDLGRMFWTLG